MTAESAARELARRFYEINSRQRSKEWLVQQLTQALKRYAQAQSAEAQDMARIAHLWLRQAQFSPDKQPSVDQALKALESYFGNLKEPEHE